MHIFSEMPCALWSLPWVRICCGVVLASHNSSGLQGLNGLARKSHLAATALAQTCV
jgi:hypothetical protein